MRILTSILVLSALSVSLCAQAPSGKQEAGAVQRKSSAAEKYLAMDAKSGKTPVPADKAKKQYDAEPEEGTVIVDSKADSEEAWSSAAEADKQPAERPDADVPGGMPASYGQCKGVVTEGGRTILIFENPDDGALYFVQVTVGKNNVAWKLVDKISRSAD